MTKSTLIKPYGGILVDLRLEPEALDEARAKAARLKSVQLSERSACDLELLATGAFSPLDRFLGEKDYRCVLDEMRLANGTIFPMPVTLSVPRDADLHLDDVIALRDSRNDLLAMMEVEEIYTWSWQEEALQVLGSGEDSHSLVAEMANWGDLKVSGRLQVLRLPRRYDFQELRLTAAQVRDRLEVRDLSNVVAFQTHGPVHRLHEELTKRAARELDATLLLHPIVGMTEPGDVDHYTRIRTYKALVARYEEPRKVLLSILQLATRHAGPREALWHAIVQRNFGANYMLVGRDYRNSDEALDLVNRNRDEVGVTALPFDEIASLADESRYEGPSEMTEILADSCPPRHKQGFCIWFTGLSGAGKSTTADILTVLLLEHGRQVTLLDGDVVRTHLSKGLGFSREDRDANIRRIGFVAAEIVRHGGAVICAAVSPYRATRDEVRRLVGMGRLVEVFVDTPLSECERRDVKGMYARARRGEIHGFTGIDDPYEPPFHPELILETIVGTPEENARRVLDYLIRAGFVRRERLEPELAEKRIEEEATTP